MHLLQPFSIFSTFHGMLSVFCIGFRGQINRASSKSKTITETHRYLYPRCAPFALGRLADGVRRLAGLDLRAQLGRVQAAAVAAAMTDAGRGSRRSPSPHLSKAAAGSNETCRRLQRAAASVCNEASPALRLGEDLARRLGAPQPSGSSSTPPQSARRSSKGPTAAPAPSPARA